MGWTRIFSVFLAVLAVAAPASADSAPPLKPEDAYLSTDRYLNRYFGLSLAIPKALNLAPIPVPTVQGDTRWLLALGNGTAKPSVTVTITAAAPPKKDNVASAMRHQYSDSYPGPSKPVRVDIGGETFWRISVPAKPEPMRPQIIEYAAVVRDYLLIIRIATQAGAIPDGFTQFVESAVFVSPAEVAANRPAAMSEYSGPALPELGQPTHAIAMLPSGTTDGRLYHNDAIGIAFRVPDGLQPQSARELAESIASGRLPAWGWRTEAGMQHLIAITCTRPLLFAEGLEPRNDGHVNPAVMITAMDPVCLQGAHMPASVSDKPALQAFARVLSAQIFTQRPGLSVDGRAYSVSEQIFLSLSGTFYGTEPGTGLRIPNRVRLIATQRNGYVVVWTFVAPDSATVDRLAGSSVRFYRAENDKGSAEPPSSADSARN